LSDDVERWVLDEVSNRTEPAHDASQVLGRLWTSRHNLLHEHTGRGQPHSHDEIEAAISRLDDRQEILYWNGQVTLATDEYLTAVIASEKHSDIPRQILIAKCNRYLQDLREDPEVATDGGEL
jgi:hypothetical protein